MNIGGGTVVDSWHDHYEYEEVPKRFEAGLQDYSGIIGLGEAVNYLRKIGFDDIERNDMKLNKIITEELLKDVELIGPEDYTLRPSIFSFHAKAGFFSAVADNMAARRYTWVILCFLMHFTL